MFTIYSYIIYLIVSVILTVWVARTLHQRGRVFLIDAFHGNETLADSVNHLLVVGFYLINIGYVTLALKYGDKPASTQEAGFIPRPVARSKRQACAEQLR